MKIPTHLLAIELVPGLGQDPHQPSLPGMPTLPHRVRVHQFLLTTAGFRETPDGPWLTGVDDMEYIASDWVTLPARSVDLDTACSQVKRAVARAYAHSSAARPHYDLTWHTQQHLTDTPTSLVGQVWEGCLGWASTIVLSDRSVSLRRWQVARRLLQAYMAPYTVGQSRSQLWVAVGMTDDGCTPPGELAMSLRGTGLKKEKGAHV